MNRIRLSALVGVLAGLLVISAAPGLLAVPGGSGGVGATGSTGQETNRAAATSLSYEFSDFFNVPWGEWWDLRFAIYGDRPIGAECFSQAGITAGLCAPSDQSVMDIDTYPYTHWYPGIGNPLPGNPNSDIYVNAPYRMRVTGAGVQGYTLAEPVYFPVLNPSAAAGSRLDFNWRMQYITGAEAEELETAGCSGVVFGNDGYIARSQIALTMDLQESRRTFGVVGANADEARIWWQTNTNPGCSLNGPAENAVIAWFRSMGGTSTAVGKYDIYNSFEWFYQIFFLQMSATVDADGTTHVMIDHGAWGTEVLLARFFYWGAAPYIAPGPDGTFFTADDVKNYLDSTKAAGWRGDEVAWFEDFTFAGNFGASDHGFTLTAAMYYHFQQLADPGSDGLLNQVGDIPYWQWGAWLNDYVNDFSPRHLASELDRIPGKTIVQSSPGHANYGGEAVYDFTPHTWDIASWETLALRFPTGDVVYYDPNLTPKGAHPLNQYIEIIAPMKLFNTKPAGFGTWDELTNTWTLVGALSTGAPVGSPGPDGVPGTADDQYPLEPFPQINLDVEFVSPELRAADLVGRSAWPAFHHLDKSARGTTQTLFAKVGNLGNQVVTFRVTWEVRDATGALLATLTADGTVDVALQTTLSQTLDVGALEGRFLVMAWVEYDRDGDGGIDTRGAKLKQVSFAVVP